MRGTALANGPPPTAINNQTANGHNLNGPVIDHIEQETAETPALDSVPAQDTDQ